MNYKSLSCGFFSLTLIACSHTAVSERSAQAIDRFQVQDDVVTDTRSQLMWTRCLLGATWNGTTCEGKAASYGWQEAQDRLKTFIYAGYGDWRIPTLAELKTLVDNETETAVPTVKIPHVNQSVFPTPYCKGAARGPADHDGHSCWQWTSTPVESNAHYGWIVYFDYAYHSGIYEADRFALRLVRNYR